MDFPRSLHAFVSRVSLERRYRRDKPLSSLSVRSVVQGGGPAVEVFTQLVALAVLVFVSPSLSAQNTSHCQGPAELEKTIADHPSAAAYDALGAHFASQSRFSCAISAFKSALRLEPDSWQGHYNLGIALLTSGDIQQAADELKTALRLSPGSDQILLPLGVALSKLDRQDEAIDAFRAVLQKDPHSVRALDGLTKALIEQKRYTAAIAALKDSPDDEVLRLNLAIAYSRNGNLDDAIRILSAMAKDHPDYAQGRFNLGIVFTQQNRFNEAAQEFQEAVRLDPSNDEARVSLVKTLVILAQFDAAAPIIREYLQRKPHDFDALYLSGVVERGLGNFNQAEKDLRQAVALKPDDFEVLYNLGYVLAHLGKPEQARPLLEKALKIDPNSSKVQFQLASVHRALGMQDQARDELSAFQKQKAQEGEQLASVKANQGNEDLETGKAEKAVDMYREAITKDPNNARTYYNLALAEDRLGDIDAERQALETAEQLDASLALVHNQLGLLHLKANRTADAEREFKTAIQLDPQYAEAQNNLGVLLRTAGSDAGSGTAVSPGHGEQSAVRPGIRKSGNNSCQRTLIRRSGAGLRQCRTP